MRNARHQNTRLRRVFVTKVGDYRSQVDHLWSYETFSTRRMLPSETFVCHLHGSALPDPSRDLSSPSDFSRNDFPRPKSHIIHENAINLSMQMTRNQETHLRSPSYFFCFSTTFKQHLAAQSAYARGAGHSVSSLVYLPLLTSLFPPRPIIFIGIYWAVEWSFSILLYIQLILLPFWAIF